MSSYEHPEHHTPMLQQWARIKKQHPNALLLFRMGDFYELFFEDAQKIAKLLDITLTHRGESAGQKVPMAGVPFHAVEQYLARLVRQGVSCVIAEQFGELGQGLLERRVTRIITPGTVTESEWIGEKADSGFAAIHGTEDGWYAASVNLSTGAFLLYGPNEDLGELLYITQCTELLHREDVKIEEVGVAKTPFHAAWFTREHGHMLVQQCFGLNPLGLGWELHNPIWSCVGAVLQYVLDTQKCVPSHLGIPQWCSMASTLRLDASTRRNLELDIGLQGGSAKTLWGVLDTCSTPMGSRLLRQWVTQPNASIYEAKTRLHAVETLTKKATTGDMSWVDALAWCGDPQRVVARIGLGTVRPIDLVALRETLRVLPTIRSGLLLACDGHTGRLASIVRSLEDESKLLVILNTTIAENPRTLIREGGVIADGVDTELDECRTLLNNSEDVLRAIEHEQREVTGITSLRVDYNRNSGYTLEVPKGQVDKVPLHYTRKQSLKNVERYTISVLRDFETKALTAQYRALKRERQVYDALVCTLQKHMLWLTTMAQALASLDVLWSFSKSARKWNYVSPVFLEHPGLVAEQARHPVVEQFIKVFTPNAIVLNDTTRSLIITGPNMGGKSTYMRSCALIALMAYMGCPVSAKSLSIGPLDAICTRIGASDDVASGRSTFMVEMQEAAAIANTATSRTLILMDEVGRGTSVVEGAAIAQALFEYLHAHCKGLLFFATHYTDIAHACKHLSGVGALQAQVDDSGRAVIFTHNLTPGIATSSYGIHVAGLAGIPAQIVERAHQLVQAHTQPPNVCKRPLDVTQIDLDNYSPRSLWDMIEREQKRIEAEDIL